MTITENRIEVTAPAVTTTQLAVDPGVRALHLLHDVMSTVADLDPDLFHSTTVAGRNLVSLAALARAAVAALGDEPGPVLHDGAGVVVVREIVKASALLERVLARHDGGTTSGRLTEIVSSLESSSAALHGTITACH